MDRIEVQILKQDFDGMPLFLAKLTQRGHQITCMQDLIDLYLSNVSNKPSAKLLALPHTTIQRMCTMTVAIFGLSTKAASQLRTHAKRCTAITTSTQYSDFSDVVDPYVVPEGLTKEEAEFFRGATKNIHEEYAFLTRLCGDKDKAGYLLPQGLRKCMIIHANYPDWQYILRTRLCNRNTREVQYICQKILQAMNDQCGKVWADGCLPTCCSTGCREGHFCCGKKYEDIRN